MFYKRHTTESSKASEIDLTDTIDRYSQKTRDVVNDGVIDNVI